MLISPFPKAYRGSGLLLHVTSLPTRFGIGDLGPYSYRWIDLLAAAGQSWWQILPLGPTGYGNCPYQLTSACGINPLLVSPEALVEEGLLKESEIDVESNSEGPINFDDVTVLKRQILERAWKRFRKQGSEELQQAFAKFVEQQQDWLDDFALFQCFRAKYKTGSFWKWPHEVAGRQPAAMRKARDQFADQIEQTRFEQFVTFRQLTRVKVYANSKGVRLIGDLPFFASPESADVWTNPQFFLLDSDHHPQFVAGVPPDYFSPDGQLWGNPVYNWNALRESKYDWWLKRVRALLNQVDVIRLDHFRAFAAAWHVPADSETALSGAWQPGPGADFFKAVQQDLGALPFLAEDLGDITPDVTALRDKFRLTGMRVLQFAFDGDAKNPFLPENFSRNSVAYTATHDNDTSRSWYQSLEPSIRQNVRKYLGRRTLRSDQVAAEMIRLIWTSSAAVTIAPLQDLLNLGSEHRMNVPGCSEGNWQWRCLPEMVPAARLKWLRELTDETKRGS